MTRRKPTARTKERAMMVFRPAAGMVNEVCPHEGVLWERRIRVGEVAKGGGW